jgi:hypothetical protein
VRRNTREWYVMLAKSGEDAVVAEKTPKKMDQPPFGWVRSRARMLENELDMTEVWVKVAP